MHVSECKYIDVVMSAGSDVYKTDFCIVSRQRSNLTELKTERGICMDYNPITWENLNLKNPSIINQI